MPVRLFAGLGAINYLQRYTIYRLKLPLCNYSGNILMIGPECVDASHRRVCVT